MPDGEELVTQHLSEEEMITSLSGKELALPTPTLPALPAPPVKVGHKVSQLWSQEGEGYFKPKNSGLTHATQ